MIIFYLLKHIYIYIYIILLIEIFFNKIKFVVKIAFWCEKTRLNLLTGNLMNEKIMLRHVYGKLPKISNS